MAYQATHENSDELLTIGSDGHIVEKNKRQLKAEFSNFEADKEIVACEKPSAADIAYFSNEQI